MNQPEVQFHMDNIVRACAGYLCNANERKQLDHSIAAMVSLINEALVLKSQQTDLEPLKSPAPSLVATPSSSKKG